jgi:hypothetical protein
MDKLHATRNWLKARLSGRSRSRKNFDFSDSRKMSIVHSLLIIPCRCLVQLTHNQGHPTNFRREAITLGTDGNGNAMIIEQAREDAHDMHEEKKASKTGSGLRGHARKISA